MVMLAVAPEPTIGLPPTGGIRTNPLNSSRDPDALMGAGPRMADTPSKARNASRVVATFIRVAKCRGWRFYFFGGGGYFLKSFSIALLMFLFTFAGSFPDPSVFCACPFQIWFLAAAS